jgi:glycosyltransferase involved in cell wall biosynthesis
VLDSLRFYSNLYFHGHTVGGTNPSLLEAMASGALICAHRNIFNASILEEDAHYFENDRDISQILFQVTKDQDREVAVANNIQKIKNKYSWQNVYQQYERVFKQTLELND